MLACFGDSNTYGSAPMSHLTDIRRRGPDQRWPGILANDLGPGWHVVEEGLPGRTTVHDDPIEGAHLNGLAAVPIIVGSHSPIDVLVLALGVNDFKTRFAVTPHDIAASIGALVASIRSWSAAPGRKIPAILVVAPPPILEAGCLAGMYAGGRAKSEALSPILRQTAADLGTEFLDAGEHITSSELDGIHFDIEQHRILAAEIGKRLKGLPAG